MRRDQLNRRIQQTSLAAKAERRQSPQIIQQGKAVRAGGGGTQRLAYCKTNAPDDDEIVCYIDSDSGEIADEITVRCLIHNGSSLMYALPFLKDGHEILISKVGDEWICPGFTGSKFISLGV
ncbi:MAG: hypothetical protein JRE40_01100 [Deltaproteobacteria bacterium]|nr:hypothetical protein [Deltaproteobacteria bacterium]